MVIKNSASDMAYKAVSEAVYLSCQDCHAKRLFPFLEAAVYFMKAVRCLNETYSVFLASNEPAVKYPAQSHNATSRWPFMKKLNNI